MCVCVCVCVCVSIGGFTAWCVNRPLITWPFHWLFAVVYVSNNNEESFAQAADHSTMPPNVIVVGFYLGDEAIPYRTTVEGPSVTLGRFKQLISKRGSYRSLESDVCSFALMFFTCKLH